MELTSLSVTALREKLVAREVSPAEVLDALDARIGAVDDKIHGYLSRDLALAKQHAASADLTQPLGGVPIAIKDVINVLGEPCTCGSKILLPYRATYDATIIRRLRAHGAIPFGRANMDEFAMGGSTENSAFQSTRNPWDGERSPGGSSGGPAAAVAARLAPLAIGTDTGGSIRQPAGLCGIVGMKPTYGRVSRFGLDTTAALLLTGSRETVGMSHARLREFAGSADLLINLAGGLEDSELWELIPNRLYLDLDPGFTQLWHEAESIDMRFGGHTHFATVGLALGRAGCRTAVADRLG